VTALAHLFDAGADLSGWWIAAGGLALTVLVVEHHAVAGISLVRSAKRALAVALVATLTFIGAPLIASTAQAQPDGALLPDLISDPPRPSFFSELNAADGSTRLVVTFDGYIHNIGQGPLDVVGNPQLPQGMKQRVRSNGEWVEVGSPTVRYETDDGHNHFHLIEAIEYVLWNELQGSQTAIGSKVGFCLVDSEVVEPGQDQAYSEELDNFCQEDNPSATTLRMGITPGWRDIYDFTTTLQWVDVSDVAPGRYWIGAITDPNDEIVESNEDNNDLIFSTETIAVPGFAPRDQSFEISSPSRTISLAATPHGTVGQPIFVVEQGPSSGWLDVPVGTPFSSAEINYEPEAGFVGQDQIVYSVRDATSPYPFTSSTATVTFDVATPGEPERPSDGIAPPLRQRGHRRRRYRRRHLQRRTVGGRGHPIDTARGHLDREPERGRRRVAGHRRSVEPEGRTREPSPGNTLAWCPLRGRDAIACWTGARSSVAGDLRHAHRGRGMGCRG